MSRALAPLLRKSPVGGIVNISSIASFMGQGSCIAYMASKGALNAMTAGLARALGPEIRVNAIAPGLVETPWLQEGLGEKRYAASVVAYRERAALDAIITPEDIADAAWWLGVGARKTTGELLLVEGGFKLGRG
jgi:NAD(P)-dependent dehydrogenase (short-subunit alcohol dehydrogenase family)